MPVVHSRGSGTQGTVLLVHGTPGDHRFFQELFERAPATVLTALVDLPDHGQAPDESSLDLDPMERDLERCLGSLPAPLTLVGHSFGAYLVARLLGRRPQGVERAVFIGGFSALPPEVARGRGQLADELEAGRLGPDALESLAVQLFLGGEGSPAHEDLIRTVMRQTSPPRLLRSLRRLGQIGPRSVAPFATPSSIIHAQDDAAISHDLSRDLATVARNSQLVTLPGRSHCPQLTDADRVATMVFQRAAT